MHVASQELFVNVTVDSVARKILKMLFTVGAWNELSRGKHVKSVNWVVVWRMSPFFGKHYCTNKDLILDKLIFFLFSADLVKNWHMNQMLPKSHYMV